MRRMIRILLRDLVSEVDECTDGAEAVSAYHRHHPDWVLMDIELEQMDGITATRQITTADPDAKVVIVTSYDDPELHEAASKAGACGYVLKTNLLKLPTLLESSRRLR